jgi:hypothetical protein
MGVSGSTSERVRCPLRTIWCTELPDYNRPILGRENLARDRLRMALRARSCRTLVSPHVRKRARLN